MAGSGVGDEMCVEIPLMDDEKVEDQTEHFTVALSSNNAVDFVENSINVYIIDHDCKQF